jgi:N-acetylglucosaminyldiphosphoundecaprenol N-acetyl-beta-D-mannosaminyltransferase
VANKKILGIKIDGLNKKEILEKIKKYLLNPSGFFHITSLNPENLVLATENHLFKKALNNSQIRLIDGIGVVLAGKIFNIKVGEKVIGVDLMKELLNMAGKMRLRVLLIGGRGNLADDLTNCYQERYPEAKFLGTEGIKNIKNPKKIEEKEIFSIVAALKPHLVFVAFGSPWQELWIERHKNKFKNCVVMGVGGAFDFLSGKVPRAPVIFQKLGLEWLFRLIIQPWRLKRQLRLIRFGWLIFISFFVNLINKMISFSPKTFFEISSEIVVNLTSGWIAVLIAPNVLGLISLSDYIKLLTQNLIFVIFTVVGVVISLWFRELSKKI